MQICGNHTYQRVMGVAALAESRNFPVVMPRQNQLRIFSPVLPDEHFSSFGYSFQYQISHLVPQCRSNNTSRAVYP